MSSATLRSGDVRIPPLDDDNYKVWKELITPVLQGKGVWKYTDGSEPERKDQT